MVIYADTRQKSGKHEKKHSQIESLGYELVHKKLDVGDYMIDGNDFLSVDTKQNLGELYNNLLNDTGRFMREVRRAHESGIKLIVLTEQGNIKNIDDIAKWTNKFGKAPGSVLRDRVLRVHYAYGVEFLFCDKRVTGKKIVELLGGTSNGYCRNN